MAVVSRSRSSAEDAAKKMNFDALNHAVGASHRKATKWISGAELLPGSPLTRQFHARDSKDATFLIIIKIAPAASCHWLQL